MKTLQQKLKAKGINVGVDGQFGPKTKAAVIAFQRANGLTADGVVGPKTWAKLNAAAPKPPAAAPSTPTLKQGAKGQSVKNLQTRLRAHGHNVSVDGQFGPATRNAVLAFQRAKGLGADGVVGPQTWAKLNAAPSANNNPTPSGSKKVAGYVNGKARTITVSPIGNGKFLRSDAAVKFNAMKAAAARAGVTLHVNSGFRTMAEQRYLYNLYKAGKGNLAARPGYSNHQGGLSADINAPGGYSGKVYNWLKANAHKYGFKNDVGGEPWHWTFKG